MVHRVGNSSFYFATFTNLLSLFSKPPTHVQSKFLDEFCSTPKFQVFHFLERNVLDETLISLPQVTSVPPHTWHFL